MAKKVDKQAETAPPEQPEENYNSTTGERSVDSGVMVNDQIKATLDLIYRIEQNLKEDINS
jgi:hypothetical protein